MKRAISIGLAVAFILLCATSVHADDRRRGWSGGDRDWHAHEVQAHRYWHRPRFHPAPNAVYAPPVVYAPPPEQYEPPGINLILPLHIH